MKKRPPQRTPKKKNDVYVNRKTDFKAQLERCQKLLDSRYGADNKLNSEVTKYICDVRFTFCGES